MLLVLVETYSRYLSGISGCGLEKGDRVVLMNDAARLARESPDEISRLHQLTGNRPCVVAESTADNATFELSDQGLTLISFDQLVELSARAGKVWCL